MISLNSYKTPATAYLQTQHYGELTEASITLTTVNWYSVTESISV